MEIYIFGVRKNREVNMYTITEISKESFEILKNIKDSDFHTTASPLLFKDISYEVEDFVETLITKGYAKGALFVFERDIDKVLEELSNLFISATEKPNINLCRDGPYMILVCIPADKQGAEYFVDEILEVENFMHPEILKETCEKLIN